MDENYLSGLSKDKDLHKKLPVLNAWMAIHIVCTPYNFSTKKCDDASCCGPLRTTLEFCAIAMQRQPTPRNYTNRPGNFLRRGDALHLYGDDPASCANLSDLPSTTNIDNILTEKRKESTARDVAVMKNLKLKSWEVKKVKGILKCFHCNNPRCYFSQQHNDEHKGAVETLWLKMESISFR